jgi:hypothetical protein
MNSFLKLTFWNKYGRFKKIKHFLLVNMSSPTYSTKSLTRPKDIKKTISETNIDNSIGSNSLKFVGKKGFFFFLTFKSMQVQVFQKERV